MFLLLRFTFLNFKFLVGIISKQLYRYLRPPLMDFEKTFWKTFGISFRTCILAYLAALLRPIFCECPCAGSLLQAKNVAVLGLLLRCVGVHDRVRQRPNALGGIGHLRPLLGRRLLLRLGNRRFSSRLAAGDDRRLHAPNGPRLLLVVVSYQFPFQSSDKWGLQCPLTVPLGGAHARCSDLSKKCLCPCAKPSSLSRVTSVM